jgi:hypothetical protein
MTEESQKNNEVRSQVVSHISMQRSRSGAHDGEQLMTGAVVESYNWFVRVNRYGFSMCHCLECQRRTGAVFGNQAWFNRQQITSIVGISTEFKRVADSGNSVTFRFCAVCGSTVYREAEGFPGLIAVAVGSFADPAFPAPAHSVCERRRHHWVEAAFGTPVEHSN